MNEVKQSEEMQNEKVYSRRDMLKTAGMAAAGVAVVTVIPSFITGCAKKTPELPTKEVLNYEYLAASEDAPQYPFPYQKLDPATTMERAYASFFNKGGCCRAVIDGVIGQLGDNAGYAMGDPERKARCAGVAADCAGKTAELLNAYYKL